MSEDARMMGRHAGSGFCPTKTDRSAFIRTLTKIKLLKILKMSNIEQLVGP